MTRTLAIALAGIAASGAIAAGYAVTRDAPRVETPRRVDAARLMNDLMAGTGTIGGPFALSDTSGRRVTLADFRGKIVVLYFGYTFCPDVCPTDLVTIAKAIDALGADRDKVQPLFVTLDPERDTPQQLAAYVKSFSPRIVALTGTPEEIRGVALLYRVFYEKVREKGSKHYVIDQTAFTYVIDADGAYAGFFPPGTGAERMAAVVRETTISGR